MGEIIKSVEVRANSDAINFFEKHNYKEVLEKYAYVRNRFLELNKLIDSEKMKGDYSERDYEELFYYAQYWYSLAVGIANTELNRNGYEKGNDGKWEKDENN